MPYIDEPTHSSGALLVGGDWAIAHGDIATLAHVSKLLASRTSESLRADLLDLVQLCYADIDLAARRWPLVREQVCIELRSTQPLGCD